ncbi:sensor histidine kinase [Falsibacillus pallidus]|uniref:sensor histidine kinase n=1 Tax=Falsibacillus pallidus TaxID=493781 RepID=UPI003D969D3D
MIRKYIWERKSWLVFVIAMELLFIFVAMLDEAIPLSPILYMVFLSSILFIIFAVIRYQRETKYYKRLEEWDNNLNVTDLEQPDSPFEKIISKSLTIQADLLKESSSDIRTAMEKEKDDLLSWIHEVKTPLTAMHLIIERMEDQMLKSQLKYEWLRIHLLLDQQLHQKRITFIENDLYIEKVDLETIFFGEFKTLQSWCIQKGIGFDLDLIEAEVLSDAKWLAFILRQVLTNAVKYSEASEIIIKSRMENDRTILSIQDFGRGIELKDLPRIFDRGFTSTVDHHDNASTGMGLYLAKKAAVPLLIDIQVSSIRGEGTTFTLVFPRKNDFVGIMEGT